MGGYLLARGRNLSLRCAVMVALVAALNGWIICWGATDWFGALGAFAWLPWAWWAMERALDSRRSRWRFLWPAPFVYLVVTGGFPYTVLMLAVLAAWLAFKSLGQARSLSSIWPLLVGVALGFGLSAPAWLALLDYVQGSARQAQESSAHFQWLVPASVFAGFYPSELDRELGGFFHASDAAYCDRVGVRISSADRLAGRVSHARTRRSSGKSSGNWACLSWF